MPEIFKKITWLLPSKTNPTCCSYCNLFLDCGFNFEPYFYNERLLLLDRNSFESELIEFCKHADLVIVSLWSSSHELSPELIYEIRKNSRTVLFSLDDEIYSTMQSISYANSIDLVISTDFFGRGLFEQAGVPTIYFPFHKYLTNYNTSGITEKTIDVSFIGNSNVADRKNYLQALIDAGVQLEVFGAGSKNGYISKKDYIEIIKKSRINLNFTKPLISKRVNKYEPWRHYMRQIKGRPFEVAALGSFCLSEWSPPSKYIFSDKTEIPLFNCNKTLIEKVHFYLSHSEERELCARSTNKRFLERYSFPGSFIALMNEIKNNLDSNNSSRLLGSNLHTHSMDYLERANLSYLQKFVASLSSSSDPRIESKSKNAKRPIQALIRLAQYLNYHALIFSILKSFGELYRHLRKS